MTAVWTADATWGVNCANTNDTILDASKDVSDDVDVTSVKDDEPDVVPDPKAFWVWPEVSNRFATELKDPPTEPKLESMLFDSISEEKDEDPKLLDDDNEENEDPVFEVDEEEEPTAVATAWATCGWIAKMICWTKSELDREENEEPWDEEESEDVEEVEEEELEELEEEDEELETDRSDVAFWTWVCQICWVIPRNSAVSWEVPKAACSASNLQDFDYNFLIAEF